MTPPTTRARSAAAKRERAAGILGAARALATATSVRTVTLTDIADEVGLHKSAMLRYFETREQIFLDLMAESWQEWSVDVSGALAALHPATDDAVAATVADSLVARPLFCDLLAQTPMNLERNVSLDAVARFKLVALDAHARVVGAVDAASGIGVTAAGDVVTTATTLAGGLWQMAAAGTALRQLYEEHPDLAHARVDVAPQLTRTVATLLRGSRPTT